MHRMVINKLFMRCTDVSHFVFNMNNPGTVHRYCTVEVIPDITLVISEYKDSLREINISFRSVIVAGCVDAGKSSREDGCKAE